jgi:hypothetical protein
MNYIKPETFININDYDYIISIGNKCPSTLLLRSLNLYKESFPFDYIPTTPQLILKYLKDTSDFFPEKNKFINKSGVWFGHFNISDKYDETIETFKRRFNRLFEILQNKKKVLFLYTSEADIYNELNNRYNNNYDELSNITDYIKNTYKYDDFIILAVHTNKIYKNTKNIINYTINVPNIYLSDDMSTHINPVVTMYRETLKILIKEIFKIN